MKKPGKKLYRVEFDGQPEYVEADDFRTAIDLWRAKLLAEWTEDGAREEGDEEIEPDSVTLVHDEPVLR